MLTLSKKAKERLIVGLKWCQLPVDERSISQFVSQFERFYALLLRWNERLNLTTIVEDERVVVEHFVDSLAPLALGWVGEGERVIDIGTGAGLPGIPLALCLPNAHITLLEATLKKVNYLRAVCHALGLNNVETIWGRAEDWGHQQACREKFNVAVVRAFGRLDVGLECALPFVLVGGIAVAYKGPKVDAELEYGRRAAERLGGQMQRVEQFTLPTADVSRTLVIVKKTFSTPANYPRRPGLPKKMPLGGCLKTRRASL